LTSARGLVYSLTAKEKHPELAWYQQPLTFGLILLAACVLLNILILVSLDELQRWQMIYELHD
jgi:hypothetical protein